MTRLLDIRRCLILGLWLIDGASAFVPTIGGITVRQQPIIGTQLFATDSSGLTIFGHADTRSPLFDWACLELGISLDNVAIGDLSVNPHPFGQVPCLTDNKDVVVFESGAMLHYLQQEYYSKNDISRKDAAVTSWIAWAYASLDPICFLPDGNDTGLRQPNKRIDRLDEMMANSAWLVGDGDDQLFTLADVAVASCFFYVYQFYPDIVLNDKWPSIVIYLNSAVQRPAYAQAFGAANQQQLLSLIQADMTR
jgi:glutathione S-transferase